MNTNTVRAKVAKIQIAGIELDSFQMPDGSYQYGFEALAEIATIDKHLLSKKTSVYQLSRLLNPDGVSEIINCQAKVEGIKKPYIVLTQAQFGKALGSLARLGHPKAIALLEATFEETLQRRSDAVWGVKQTDEEHESLTKARYAGKLTRRNLTDAIKWYVENHDVSSNYKKFIYSNVSDVLNRYVLGCSSKQAMKLLGLSGTSVLRDGLEAQVVKALDVAELVAMQCIDIKGLEPMQAIKEALTFTRQFHLV